MLPKYSLSESQNSFLQFFHYVLECNLFYCKVHNNSDVLFSFVYDLKLLLKSIRLQIYLEEH